MLRLTPEAAAALAAHAEATYPDECVGLLLGSQEGDAKLVVAVFPVENRWAGQLELASDDDAHSRRDRFYLDPRDYLRADREARARGLDLVGCYHSHPDSPPTPSERDRVGAQALAGADFAFAIQEVRAGRAAALASWLLAEEGARFAPEPVEVLV
jgi:proteasome lid subunit RPN8/RPN11